MTHLRSTVREAAVRLDADSPAWFTQVDPAKLVMSNCSLCVLGQLHGDYSRASAQRFLAKHAQLHRAFTPQTVMSNVLLKFYWTREITARRAKSSHSSVAAAGQSPRSEDSAGERASSARDYAQVR